MDVLDYFVHGQEQDTNPAPQDEIEKQERPLLSSLQLEKEEEIELHEEVVPPNDPVFR